MLISGINSYKTNTARPVFRSSSREYFDPKLMQTNRTWGNIATTTWMFRQDLDWEKFTKFAYKNFINCKYVNTYSLACSDGSEAYSFIISALEKLPKDAYRKFIPLTAIDRDFEIINSARQGKINLSTGDIGRINMISGFRHNKYFINKQPALNVSNDRFLEQCNAYDVNPDLRNKVIFKRANLLNYLASLKDSGNSIVFCRNVTPYLSMDNLFDLANTAGRVLKKGSLIVFGEFDKHSGILDFIDVKGFEQCMDYVFRKM